MGWVKRLGGRLPDFADVVSRFPVAVAVMAACTLWIIFQNHTGRIDNDESYILGGFILTGYAAVIGQLIAEARNWSRLRGVLLAMALAAPAFLICYFGKQLDFIVPMAIGAAILFLGNAAAWRQERDDASVWNFSQKLWTGAIFAVIGSLIFMLGMIAISEAVRALFGVKLNDLTIDTILPIGLAFLAPVYWMGTLPRYGDAEAVEELSFEARALSFLGTWMLAPLVTIYALIILAYAAKILVQWELPKGEIAQLVTPFLGVGILVWLMLEPKVLKEGAFVRFYRAAWHWVMLPATVLLGIAVFVRIREYGYTTERFLLTMIVTWALLQSLWFTVGPKVKRDIRVPTLLAAGLFMLGAVAAGPVSLANQFERAKMAKQAFPNFDTKAIAENPKAAKAFLGGLEYMVREKNEKRFKKLLPDQDMPTSIYDTKWDKLIKSLGLDEVETTQRYQSNSFSLTSTQPVNVPADSQFFGAYQLYIDEDGANRSANGIVTSREGSKLTLEIAGKSFLADFTKLFSEDGLAESIDPAKDYAVPPMTVRASDGTEATLIILDGYLVRYETSRSANLTVALIVPN